MKKVIYFFKNHYGKIFAGTTGTIVFTVGGFLFSDMRYAHTEKVNEINQSVETRLVDLENKVKQLEDMNK